jgi:hypothetical protein
LQVDRFDLQRQTAGTPFGSANLRADDTSVGVVAGIDYAPSLDTSIGLGFRSAVDHTLEGHLSVDGVAEAPIKASIILPEMLSLGVRHSVSPTTRLLAEAEWVNWSRLNVIPIELQGPFLGLPSGATAANLDFRWRDGWLFAVGATHYHRRSRRERHQLRSRPSMGRRRGGQTPTATHGGQRRRVYKTSADTRLSFAYGHVLEESVLRSRGRRRCCTPFAGDGGRHMDVISTLEDRVGGVPAVPGIEIGKPLRRALLQ